MRHHCTALLGHSGLVQRDRMQPVDVGCRGEQRIDRHHSRPADARHQDAIPVTRGGPDRGRRQIERGQVRQRHSTQPAPRLDLHGYERGAIAPRAGVVGVARGLMHAGLRTVFRFDRQQRHAVRFLDAIPAALADALVDQDPARGLRHLPATAPTALLGGAQLVVNHDRHALHALQFGKHRLEVFARSQLGRGRQTGLTGVLARLVTEHYDLADALGLKFARQGRHGQRSGGVLAAGHRHGVVVENLERDVDVRRDRRLHRQAAGMKVGAVT